MTHVNNLKVKNLLSNSFFKLFKKFKNVSTMKLTFILNQLLPQI